MASFPSKVGADEDGLSSNEEDSHPDVVKALHQKKWNHRGVSCMPLVECPKCGTAYRGSRDRLQRLLNHALQCHKKKQKEIVCHIIKKYYPLASCWIREEGLKM